ncbi:MAG TPA: DUF4340 domain-containing protein [Candidatus Sumerlaeota bacterium]|nr:DUF4340 domain-containing protein [Candidatus Sumerlaeota bacterium]
MKPRNIYITAAVAIALVVLVFVMEKPLDNSGDGASEIKTDLAGIEKVAVFEKVSDETCARVDISRMDGLSTATIQKLDSVWYANPERRYTASVQNVERVFSTLAGAKSGEVISRNPENHARFQVDKMTGLRVRFYDKSGGLLEDVYVGKSGQNYMAPTSYVRREGEDQVLQVPGMLSHIFQTGEDSWRERTIFDIDPENIAAFFIREPGKPPVHLARLSGGGWTCLAPEPSEVRSDVGTRLLNTFSRMRVGAFLKDYPQKPFAEYGLGENDAWVITASLKDYSTTPTLYLGNESGENPGQYYVRAEGSNDVHLIYKYNRDSLACGFNDIGPTPIPSPTPEQDLVKKVQEEYEKKKQEVENMTEGEKLEAVRRKRQEILAGAEQKQAAVRKDDTPTTPGPRPAAATGAGSL